MKMLSHAHPTLIVYCNIYTPDGERYDRDPRGIAEKAEEYSANNGYWYSSIFSLLNPNFSFSMMFVMRTNMNKSSFEVDSEEAAWNTGT